MKLKEEWNKRIQIWIEELSRHFYYELGSVEFEGMFTYDRLNYEEAVISSGYNLVPSGTKWGRKWEYGWFKAWLAMPSEAEGKRIYLKPETGGESLVFVNNRAAGAKDLEHDGITLTRNAAAGERFFIVLESYAGHGPRVEGGGPCPPERITVPEPPLYQAEAGLMHYGIWNEEAFQLYMDAVTLYRLYQSLDERSLRAMKIRSGLEEFTKVVQFELPYEERNMTYRDGRKVLEPLLLCTNGSTAPEYTIFGQSHLDLAWKWPFEETVRKCARTISTQLSLMEEYDEYKFLLCQPPIMEALKENYTEIYSRVKDKVEHGRFMPEGGVYVECDTVLPSGESLIRQCIWGKKWFYKEYGCDVLMVWLPDCFGFSGQLPQIFTKSGIKYFATQKISRALKGAEIFPYNVFMWEGIDGSRILTHFYKKNNSRIDPYLLNERWYNDRVQQEDIDTFLFPFGFGDGGGGPVREMLETARRCADLEGAPRTIMQSPTAFFEELEQKGTNNKYVGEIYLAWHRGTLTAQAGTKRGNRKAEFSLRELEFWSCMSKDDIVPRYLDNDTNAAQNVSFEKMNRTDLRACMHDLWKRLLFNQFHDILPGTSIERVHKEAEEDFKYIITKSEELCSEVLKSMIDRNGDAGITIFNSLSWERKDIVKLPESWRGAEDSKQCILAVQESDGSYYAEVSVPSCGYMELYPVIESSSCVGLQNDNDKAGSVIVEKLSDGYSMENDYIKIIIDLTGRLISIFDKESEIEFADEPCNDICMYQDINIDYDAWEISSFYEELPVRLDENAQITIKDSGPLFGSVLISRKINESLMEQEIIMTSFSRRIDFKTRIDWRETHKLLKVSFPVNVSADEAIEEIQFGYVKRPTHRSRRYDADRYEVCNHKYTLLAEAMRGFAVLNDCKYGVSTNGNNIQLSLLRSPVQPDMHADKGLHEFTYAVYAYTGSFYESDVVRQGYELNTSLLKNFGNIGMRSLIQISSQSVILESVKAAEDGSNDIILRLYEAYKGHAVCWLELDFHVLRMYETDMLEDGCIKVLDVIGVDKVRAKLSFGPFEIKTLRVVME